MKSVALILVVSVVFTLALISGCAQPAPSPTAVPSPTGTSTSTATSSPKADPLAAIIAGAKKEGTAALSLVASYTPAPLVQKLRSNIKEKYGVDLDLKVTGSEGYGELLAQSIMEQKSGIPPTYDLMAMTDQFLALGNQQGAFEKVDWKTLVGKEAAPEIVPQHPSLAGSIIFQGTATGLMYNSSKIPADQAPKTLKELADPKWKGKLGVFNYESHWTRWAFVLGKDKTIAALKDILKTKPLLGTMNQLNNKYLLGEIDMAFLSSAYIRNNADKGVPTAFRPLDYLDARNTYLTIAKTAAHPNAAKLVALYFTTPEGVKFTTQDADKGHFFYPGNHLYDAMVQAKKDGIPMHAVDTYPGLLEFTISPDQTAWEKEIGLIIKGG